MDAEHILRQLGTCGRYQVKVFTLMSLICLRGVWQLFAPVFLGADPGHRCASPGNTSSFYDVIKNDTTSLGECQVFIGGNYSNSTTPCKSGWEYGKEFQRTIVTEWDLVCEDAYLLDLSSSVFMSGMLIGSVVLTPLADRFGRKRVLLAALWAQGIVGALTSLANSFILFTILRFVIGVLNQTIGLVACVILPEAFPASNRTVPYIGMFLFWSAGVMSLALLGFLVRDWRYLQLVISLPNFLMISYYWFLPESIPWLMSTSKTQQANKVVKEAARMNKREIHSDFSVITFSAFNKSLLDTETRRPPEETEVTTGNHHGRNSVTAPEIQSQATQVKPDTVATPMFHVTTKQTLAFTQDTTSQSDLTSTELRLLPELDDIPKETGLKKNCISNHKFSSEGSDQNELNNSEKVVFPCLGVPLSSGTDLQTNSCCVPGSDVGMTSSQSESVLHEVDREQPYPLDETSQSTKFGKVKYGILDLFRTPKMRLYSLLVFYLWFANSVGYFGMTFLSSSLHGDRFLNLFFSGLAEIPAYVIAMFFLERVGRRLPLCIFMVTSGVFSIVATILPQSVESDLDIGWLRTSCALIAKFAVTGSYVTIYLLCVEIFPTVLRNLGTGIAAAFETLGAMAAPFVASSAKDMPELPLTLFAALTIVGGGLCLVLPETHGKPLPETVEEVEGWRRKASGSGR